MRVAPDHTETNLKHVRPLEAEKTEDLVGAVHHHHSVHTKPDLEEALQELQQGRHHMIIETAEEKRKSIAKAEEEDWEHEVIEPVLEYEFKESLWDAGFFLFERRTELVANLFTLLLLLIHIGSQVIFMGILYKFFMKPEFGPETVEEMTKWRVNVGQSQFWVDPADTGISLSARVCAMDGSVGAEFDKVDTLKNMKQYWDWESPNKVFSGPALAVVCMTAWAMTCFGEIRSTLTCAYLLLGCTERGETLLAGNQEHGFSLMRISTGRAIWIFFLMASQLIIAVSILIAGLIFISSTTQIETLLLHALAMEIIFTIDERLFEALCPVTMKNLVKCMKPLERPTRAWRGLDLFAATMAATSCIAIWAVFGTTAMQTLSAVKDVHTALCGGQTNFYYGGDGTGVLWAVQPSPQKLYTAAESVVDLFKEGGSTEYPFLVSSFSQMSNKMNSFTADMLQLAGKQSTTSNTTKCVDLIVSPDKFETNPTARAVTKYGPNLGEEDIKNCEDVKYLCSTESMVRSVCPATCGCNDPVGGVLIADSGGGGCPSFACQNSDDYLKKVAAAPCQDSVASSPWDSWSQEFEQILKHTAPPLGVEWPCEVNIEGKCSTYFKTEKCNIISRWMTWAADLPSASQKSIELCFSGQWSDGLFLNPLATLCPITCNCNLPVNADQSTCPSKCR